MLATHHLHTRMFSSRLPRKSIAIQAAKLFNIDMEQNESYVTMDKPRVFLDAGKDLATVFKITKGITYVGLPVALYCMYSYSAPIGLPFVCATFFATSFALKTYQLNSGKKRFIQSLEILEGGEHVKMIDLEGKELVIAVKDFNVKSLVSYRIT